MCFIKGKVWKDIFYHELFNQIVHNRFIKIWKCFIVLGKRNKWCAIQFCCKTYSANLFNSNLVFRRGRKFQSLLPLNIKCFASPTSWRGESGCYSRNMIFHEILGGSRRSNKVFLFYSWKILQIFRCVQYLRQAQDPLLIVEIIQVKLRSCCPFYSFLNWRTRTFIRSRCCLPSKCLF